MVGMPEVINTNLSDLFLKRSSLVVFGDRLTFVELVVTLLLSSIVSIMITFCLVLAITVQFRPIRFDVGVSFAIVAVIRVDFISLIFDSLCLLSDLMF